MRDEVEASSPTFLNVVEGRVNNLALELQNWESFRESKRFPLDKCLGIVLELMDACSRERDRYDSIHRAADIGPQAEGAVQVDDQLERQRRTQGQLIKATAPQARSRRIGRRGGRRR